MESDLDDAWGSSLHPRGPVAIPVDARVIEPLALETTTFKLPDAEDFEVDPISPGEYLDELQSQGVSFWPCVREDLARVYSGPHFSPAYRCVVMLGGIGSAKTTTMETVFGFLADWLLRLKSPMKAMGKREIDQIAMINMAPSEPKAREILFSKFKAHVERNPRLAQIEHKELERYLVFPEKRVWFASGNSSAAFPQGADLFAAVIDECTSFITERGDKVEGLYKAIEERRMSRFGKYGMVALIGEGGRKNCWAEHLMAEAKNDPTILAIRRSRYEANPVYAKAPRFTIKFPFSNANGVVEEVTLNPPIEFKAKYEKDRVDAFRVLDGYPATAGRPFFDAEIVARLIDRSRDDPCPDRGIQKEFLPEDMLAVLPPWFRGVAGTLYAVHTDLAKGQVIEGNCAAGLAIAHMDPHKRAVLDCAVRFIAHAPHIVDPAKVEQLIRDLHVVRGFMWGSVTFDQWGSTGSIYHLANDGFPAEKYSVGYDEYLQFKTAFTGGRVLIPNDAELELEMVGLEDYDSKVFPGLGLFKDELDCVVGSCVRATCGLLKAPEAPPPEVPAPVLVQKGTGMYLPEIPGSPMPFQNPQTKQMGFPGGLPRYRSIVQVPRWRRGG